MNIKKITLKFFLIWALFLFKYIILFNFYWFKFWGLRGRKIREMKIMYHFFQKKNYQVYNWFCLTLSEFVNILSNNFLLPLLKKFQRNFFYLVLKPNFLCFSNWGKKKGLQCTFFGLKKGCVFEILEQLREDFFKLTNAFLINLWSRLIVGVNSTLNWGEIWI